MRLPIDAPTGAPAPKVENAIARSLDGGNASAMIPIAAGMMAAPRFVRRISMGSLEATPELIHLNEEGSLADQRRGGGSATYALGRPGRALQCNVVWEGSPDRCW